MSPTTEFKISKTVIPGLLEIDVSLIQDERGYFQEKFQKEKLVAVGFPEDFNPVQQNVSFNKQKGTTRGIHAEPWDKYISVVAGKVFAVFVDLRNGKNFAQKVMIEITSTKAVFVPRGVGNSYQTLEGNVHYQYFVNEHWKRGERYIGVNVADPGLAINWPISLDKAILSEKDKNLPMLKDVKAFEA
jgi:dTDP-4-dehydrorhamnose 3,5-epimerase